MGEQRPSGIGRGGAFDKARHVGRRPLFHTDRCLVLHMLPEVPARDPSKGPRPKPESGPAAPDRDG